LNALAFKIMAFFFKIRDMHLSPKNILKETGMKQGMMVLDYGCGPGSFTIAAAEIVGQTGNVYAVDILGPALKMVRNKARKKKLGNIHTIETDCYTELDNKSMDIVLLYDIFHQLTEPDKILQEIHRVLNPEGILSFSDHHMRGKKILDSIPIDLFTFQKKGNKTFTFTKTT